jgi:hypothetical protein
MVFRKEDWELEEETLNVKTRDEVRPERDPVSRFRLC